MKKERLLQLGVQSSLNLILKKRKTVETKRMDYLLFLVL